MTPGRGRPPGPDRRHSDGTDRSKGRQDAPYRSPQHSDADRQAPRQREAQPTPTRPRQPSSVASLPPRPDGAAAAPERGSARSSSVSSRADSAATLSVRDRHMRRLTDLICAKVYWFMQRDAADKKEKRFQSQIDRASHTRPDFASHLDALAQQRHQSDAERSKADRRIHELDDKIPPEFFTLLESVGDARSDKLPKVVEHPQDLDSRLASLQESMQSSMDKKIEEVTKRFESSTKELNEKNAQAMARLESTLRRNETLESNIKALEEELQSRNDEATAITAQKCNSLDEGVHAKVDDLVRRVQDSATATTTVQLRQQEMDVAMKGLVKREDLEEVVNQKAQEVLVATSNGISSFNGRLSQQDTDVKAATSRLQSLADSLDALKKDALALEDRERKLESLQPQLVALRKVVADLGANPIAQQALGPSTTAAAGPPTQDNSTALAALKNGVLVAVDAKLAQNSSQLRNTLGTISEKMGGFIGTEREKRIALDVRIKRVEETLVSCDTKIQGLSQSQTKAAEDVDEKLQTVGKDIGVFGQTIASVRDRLEDTRNQTRRDFDDIGNALMSLDSWQNNFSTKTLHEDMVRHIYEAIPKGVPAQIKHIHRRLDSLEKREAETPSVDMPHKRRKVTGETPQAAGAGATAYEMSSFHP